MSRTAALVAHASREELGRIVCPEPIGKDHVSLMPYRIPLVRALIVETKFKDNDRSHTLLADILTDYLNEWSADETPFTPGSLVLVPAPLSPARRSERGYTQTERVARKAAAQLPDVYLDTDILVRTRDTLPQTSLRRDARLKNLEGAFSCTTPPDPSHTYIVFDDVHTTGSTLRAAIQALTEAGAARVLGITLAH